MSPDRELQSIQPPPLNLLYNEKIILSKLLKTCIPSEEKKEKERERVGVQYLKRELGSRVSAIQKNSTKAPTCTHNLYKILVAN
jgi:hypothetical protein